MHKLEELNPGAKFNLLELEQIFELNKLGKEQEFQILNCWTRSTYDDWHGRVDGYYSLKDGRQVIDRGKNITDVYFVFGFSPGQERPILLPWLKQHSKIKISLWRGYFYFIDDTHSQIANNNHPEFIFL